MALPRLPARKHPTMDFGAEDHILRCHFIRGQPHVHHCGFSGASCCPPPRACSSSLTGGLSARFLQTLRDSVSPSLHPTFPKQKPRPRGSPWGWGSQADMHAWTLLKPRGHWSSGSEQVPFIVEGSGRGRGTKGVQGRVLQESSWRGHVGRPSASLEDSPFH